MLTRFGRQAVSSPVCSSQPAWMQTLPRQGELRKRALPSRISMRLVPDQDPQEIYQRVRDYIMAIAPPSVKVEVCDLHGAMEP